MTWTIDNASITIDQVRITIDGGFAGPVINPFIFLFPPTDLTLVAQTTASATFSWGRSPGAGTYNLYRDNVLIKSGITALTYTDTTVMSNRRYRYDVSAIIGPEESDRSNAVLVDIETSANLTMEVTYQEQPGEGGYPDVQWRWQ